MAEAAHATHLIRRNESLQAKIDKLKEKSENVARHGAETAEIMLGAAIGGLLQGMAKDQVKGPRIFHVPADLFLGIGGLVVGAGTDLAGDYSRDVATVSKGLLAAYATEFGHAIGERKRTTGTFFPKALPGAKASGEPSPQQVADAILAQMGQGHG